MKIGQPASTFVKPRDITSLPASEQHGPQLERDNAVVFTPTIDKDSFETAISVRSGVRNKLDYPAATDLLKNFAARDVAAKGVPVMSAFAMHLKAVAKTAEPIKATVPEQPRQLFNDDTMHGMKSLPSRIDTVAQIDADHVANDAHKPFIAAGEAFVKSSGLTSPTTAADFAKLHKHLLASSTFSQKDAEGYADVLAVLPSHDARAAVATTLRITNGANLDQLQGLLHRENFTNSVYAHGQISAVLNSPNIVLHEYGHHILASQAKVLEGAVAMQAERKHLDKADGPLTEQLLNDDWIPFDGTYQERFYRGDPSLGYDPKRINNAELLPVAMQQLSTPAAMKHLHDVDRDLFHFALGVLRPDTGKAG